MTQTLLNNRYRVLQTLGSGGFGNTFLAEDTHMPSGRRCVIKQLKPVTHDPPTYKLVQERFQREAAVLEELGDGSNQIPKLFAYFSEAGQFYLVQEYIQGDTLTQKVERAGKLSESEVKNILVSLLPVLDYIHSRRMIHRDIKPDNVIIRQRDGLPVLIDFGAVKEAMNTQVNVPGQSANSIAIGTPGYMPAEQAGGRPTYASDLYSLGLTAVFLLTGKMPQDFQTDARTGEIVWRQYAPNINPNLAMVLDRAIRFNARDRFATAKEMLNALQSGDAISEMDTVAVAPGQVPPPPNRQTPPIANSYPPQTVPVGTSPASGGNGKKPLIIGAVVAACLLVGAVGLALGLRRSPEPSGTASSSSERTSEQRTSQQPSDSASSRSQPSDSERTSEQRTNQQPSDSAPSRSQRTDSEPTSERRTNEQSPDSVPSRSRSQREETNSPPVVPESPSRRSQPSPTQARQSPSPQPENNSRTSNSTKRVPGFPPGTQQSYIKEELGKPTKTSRGLWNTHAMTYEDVVPGQVSLGYLYDPSSERVRQTEASFAPSVDLETMSTTLDRMLNNNTSADIRQGLEEVYQRKSNRFTFTSGRNSSLKGLIERNDRDRIYVAVWEADLH
jgi:serine/threonine-protein kinase